MDHSARKFLDDLLNTPGVSGYESPVQEVVRDYASGFAERMEADLHGNLILCCHPKGQTRVLLDGHCDQIGLVVSQIDENGYLFTQTIGGWDPQQLVGQKMSVWTNAGEVPGVIARKPIHLLEESERKQVVKAKELWIDIGAQSKEQSESMVRIGDSVTLRLGAIDLLNDRIAGPAIDNRVGVWVVVEALRRATESNHDCALYAVSAVQEEIGLRGAKTAAYGIDPHIGVAVDVTHATDCPSIDSHQQGDIALSAGPVIVRGPNANPLVCQRLIEICESNDIPCQLAALGKAAPNDSNALQITRRGVATGLVTIPNRYMHSAVETVSLADLDHAADLLAKFSKSVKSADEFLPLAV